MLYDYNNKIETLKEVIYFSPETYFNVLLINYLGIGNCRLKQVSMLLLGRHLTMKSWAARRMCSWRFANFYPFYIMSFAPTSLVFLRICFFLQKEDCIIDYFVDFRSWFVTEKQVFTPWCINCETISKQVEKLAKHYKGSSNLMFARIDASANEHPNLQVRVMEKLCCLYFSWQNLLWKYKILGSYQGQMVSPYWPLTWWKFMYGKCILPLFIAGKWLPHTPAL